MATSRGIKGRERAVGAVLAVLAVVGIGAGAAAFAVDGGIDGASDGDEESVSSAEPGARIASAASSPEPPSSDLPGWNLLWTDDFERDELGDGWTAYSGQPGGDPYSWWDPSHVELRDGNLVLAGYQEDGRWVTGGVSQWITQQYGRYEVRFRADPSDEITYHFLLWPERDAWPPEIDFLEDFGGARQGGAGFLHYVDDDGNRAKVEKRLDEHDFTQWHTVGVEWEPGQVEFLVDGEVWETITSDEVVPAEPMWLALQAQAGGCQRSADWGFPSCPMVGVPDRADVEIDWVAIYEPK